jgi:hypothetical protein
MRGRPCVSFTVIATSLAEDVSSALPVASEALAKVLELKQAGYRRIEVRDDIGAELDQLAVLSSPTKD